MVGFSLVRIHAWLPVSHWLQVMYVYYCVKPVFLGPQMTEWQPDLFYLFWNISGFDEQKVKNYQTRYSAPEIFVLRPAPATYIREVEWVYSVTREKSRPVHQSKTWVWGTTGGEQRIKYCETRWSTTRTLLRPAPSDLHQRSQLGILWD